MNVLILNSSPEGTQLLSSIIQSLPFVDGLYVTSSLQSASQAYADRGFDVIVINVTADELEAQTCVDDCENVFNQAKVVYLCAKEPTSAAQSRIKAAGHLWVNRQITFAQMVPLLNVYLGIDKGSDPPKKMKDIKLTIMELGVLECLGMDVSDEVLRAMTGLSAVTLDKLLVKLMRYFGVSTRMELIAAYEKLKEDGSDLN